MQCVRENLQSFFNTVDKSNGIGVEVNSDQLIIIVLYNLPCFENLQCAMESRDELSTVEALRMNIVEEIEAP